MSTKKYEVIQSLLHHAASNGSGLTTHQLAVIANCTPSYVNRVCKHLFHQGWAAYKVQPHKGNAGFKRVWTGFSYLVKSRKSEWNWIGNEHEVQRS